MTTFTIDAFVSNIIDLKFYYLNGGQFSISLDLDNFVKLEWIICTVAQSQVLLFIYSYNLPLFETHSNCPLKTLKRRDLSAQLERREY